MYQKHMEILKVNSLFEIDIEFDVLSEDYAPEIVDLRATRIVEFILDSDETIEHDLNYFDLTDLRNAMPEMTFNGRVI